MINTNPLSSLIGRTVLNGMMSMTIDKFIDKMGTIKSGDKLNYIHLVGDDGSELDLHPQHALTLMKTGSHKALSILNSVAGEVVELPQETVEVVAMPIAPIFDLEASFEQMNERFEDEPEVVVPVVKTVKINKRELTEQLYTAGHAAGLTRKAIIGQMMADLGMSAAGANTYYQNAKTKLG
jgi:hypothetical protein